MKISLIIPTYNEEKTIAECLLSLSKQTVKNFEIIIVDDGSTDSTLGILKKLKIKNFKLKILQQKHLGPALARNLGASGAQGKILVFVDADMTFDSKFIENLIKPVSNGKTKGTFSKEEYVSNLENIWARCWNVNENLPERRRIPLNYPDHQKVFRAILKSEFDRVGGFSKGGYTDDYSLSEKLGYEAEAAPTAIFYHKNPETLKEIFRQSKWVAKREYKLGFLGKLAALIRSSLPISIITGIYKSILNLNFYFLFFKIVYDFGVFIGLLDYWIIGNSAK